MCIIDYLIIISLWYVLHHNCYERGVPRSSFKINSGNIDTLIDYGCREHPMQNIYTSGLLEPQPYVDMAG